MKIVKENQKIGLTVAQEKAVESILGKCLYTKTLNEVLKTFNDNDIALYNELSNKRGLSVEMRKLLKKDLTKIYGAPYFINSSHPALNEIKVKLFDDCAIDLISFSLSKMCSENTNLTFTQFVAAGYEGLERAWRNYLLSVTEETKKEKQMQNKIVYASFKTFAQKYIWSEFQRELNKEYNFNNRHINLSNQTQKVMKSIINYVDKKISMGYGEPSIKEISEAIGVDESSVENVATLLNIGRDSCEIINDSDVSKAKQEFIVATFKDNSSNPATKYNVKKCMNTLQQSLIENLDPREFYVVCGVFGLFETEAKTLTKMAPELGVSKERVRQIKCECLAKLKKLPEVIEALRMINEKEI